eukprot:6672801-Prymnesium_polylepis.1
MRGARAWSASRLQYFCLYTANAASRSLWIASRMPWHFWVKMRISASCRAASSSSGFRCATSMRRLYSASSSLRCRSARDMTSVACGEGTAWR